MNQHLQNVSTQIRTFVRRNFNFGIIDGQPAGPMTDEENDDHDHDHLEQISNVNPLLSFYNGTERVLGRYFPIFLYFFVLLLLFFGAVALTAIGGDGSYPVVVPATSTVVAVPTPTTVVVPTTTDIPLWNKSGDLIDKDVKKSSSDSPSTDSGTSSNSMIPHNTTIDGRVAAFALFLSMCAFSALTTVLALRLMHRARAMSGNQDTNRTRMQQVFARLAAFGQVDPEVRAHLRLAMMNRDFNGEDYEMLGRLDNHNTRGAGATEIEINRLPINTITRSYLEMNNTLSSQECNVASSNSLSSTRGVSSSSSSSSSSRLSCAICLAPYEEGEVVKTG